MGWEGGWTLIFPEYGPRHATVISPFTEYLIRFLYLLGLSEEQGFEDAVFRDALCPLPAI
jgi:hypothetical protein